MRRIFTGKKLLRALLSIIALIGLTIAAWMVVAGQVTVLRVLRYGDTQIDDFLYYPARELAASPSPYQFSIGANPGGAPLTVPSPEGGRIELDQLLLDNDTIAFLVLKDDRLVLERYYQGHTREARSQSFSMAKSFTSALIGMAIEDGYIRSVEQPVTDFIPELAERGFSQVTIHHLLTMRSGSSYVENDNPFGIHVILNYTPNLEKEILDFRMQDEPGEVWRYKSGDNALLALALDRALGDKTITEYTQERMWTPLGMEYGAVWSLDHEGDGLEKTWCCLAAAARDYLKLGRLYLHDGQWEEQQILPAAWVQASTQAGAVPDEDWDTGFRNAGVWNYGYQWWLVSKEDGSYLANGKDGQFLYVNPAAETAILRLGWSTGEMPLSQWLRLFQYLAEEADLGESTGLAGR